MKILIQGCGFIGEIHLQSILKYGLCEVALCDVDQKRLADVAARHGVSETYPSLGEALKSSMDGVIICTPNHLHRDDLVQCVEAGLNVMLEKPVSGSLQSALEMQAACERYGRFAFVAYVLRFSDEFRRMKELIDDGTLGKVFSIRASVAGGKALTCSQTDFRTRKAAGGGVIGDYSHEIDYCLWLVGKKVERVSCSGLRAVHKDWDVQDTADILLACEEDVNLSIHMDYLQAFSGRSIDISGTLGSIRWRDDAGIQLYSGSRGVWEDVACSRDMDAIYRDELIHYIDCLRTGARPLIGIDDGLRVMEVISECIRQAEDGESETSTGRKG
jgi:UDP-N-acetylglucosamine 3-dehydrogenase